MTPLLPWILVLVIDHSFTVQIQLRFATEASCIAYGESLSLHILTDLQLTSHTVDPTCVPHA
jgi:hypothetical protein